MLMKKVTAALIMQDDKILIARRGLEDKLAGMWEFPGGKIEAGETPEECLKRELMEEFLIDVTVNDFFGESIYDYEFGTIQLLAYWTSWESGELIPTVHDQIEWLHISELEQYDFLPADIPLIRKLKGE
jgi:8-oxo-dGTP diphosphatase